MPSGGDANCRNRPTAQSECARASESDGALQMAAVILGTRSEGRNPTVAPPAVCIFEQLRGSGPRNVWAPRTCGGETRPKPIVAEAAPAQLFRNQKASLPKLPKNTEFQFVPSMNLVTSCAEYTGSFQPQSQVPFEVFGTFI